MLEHFKGEEVFVKKILDYKDQVDYKQRLILTSFLKFFFLFLKLFMYSSINIT